MVKDVVKCFMCAVKGIERTFGTYYELQDHIYKDHDVHKDPNHSTRELVEAAPSSAWFPGPIVGDWSYVLYPANSEPVTGRHSDGRLGTWSGSGPMASSGSHTYV